MTESNRTLLILGGVAVVAFLVYKNATAVKPSARINASTTGPGQSISAATGQGASGSTDFWGSLGNVGKGLNSATSSVESTYNAVYDLFGGGTSTSGTGQGNNGTAG